MGVAPLVPPLLGQIGQCNAIGAENCEHYLQFEDIDTHTHTHTTFPTLSWHIVAWPYFTCWKLTKHTIEIHWAIWQTPVNIQRVSSWSNTRNVGQSEAPVKGCSWWVTDKMLHVPLKFKMSWKIFNGKLFFLISFLYLLIIFLQYLVPTSLGFSIIYLYIPLKSVIPIILIVKILASTGCSHVLDIRAVYPRWVGTSSWQRSKWPSLQLFWSGAELLGDKSRLTKRCQRSRYVPVHVSA